MRFGTLLDAVTSGSSALCGPNNAAGPKTFHATHQASASLSSTIQIKGSNWPTPPTNEGQMVALGTITLVGSAMVSDALVVTAPYKWYRAAVLTGSGTSTAISVNVGESSI